MKHGRILALIAASLTLAVLSVGANAQWNASTQFDPANNPSPTGWSYGYETSLGGSFTLDNIPNSFNGIDAWQTSFDPFLGVYHNGSGSLAYHAFGTSVLPSGQLALHPGPNGEYSIVRWTAPTTGTYFVSSLFNGLDDVGGTTTDVHVLVNGVSLFDGNINGYLDSTSYNNGALSLLQGDTLDFAVGYGSNGNYSFDTTGLDATISSAPEPASLMLVLGGAIPLTLFGRGVHRKRRNHQRLDTI